MGQDEAKRGQDGAYVGSYCAYVHENCNFQKMVFRLGESAILGLGRADMRPRWSYVATQVAILGAGSELCWPIFAYVVPRSVHVGPSWLRMAPPRAPRAPTHLILPPPGAPGTSGTEG